STAVYTPLAPYYFLDSSGQATLDSGSFSVNLVDANGNPLPDGWYAIQVVASDGAGNTWNNGGVAVVKVIDTTAPTLVSGSLQATANGTDPSTNAFLTNPDGSISINLQTNDNNGVGLGSIQYEWTDTNDQPLAGQTWVSASIYPAAVFNQQLVSAESHVTTVLGAPSGIGKLHIKLVDLAGNVSADITNSAWLVSYNPNPPLVTGITVAGLVQSGGSNYVQSSSSLQVGYTPSTA